MIKYYDYAKEREIIESFPEMIPEFIVPDLTDCNVSLLFLYVQPIVLVYASVLGLGGAMV